MYTAYRPQIPKVVLNLLIINVLVFMAQSMISPQVEYWILEHLALFPWQSQFFNPVQMVTYMFLHGGLMHLFANMFALYMFGRQLEWDLGSKRFLIYYMVCGIGAGLLHMGVSWVEIASLQSEYDATGSMTVAQQFIARSNTPTVGASGAVFGILLAFGVMHPNARIMLLFPPIPFKAKYFVLGYGVLELALGITKTASNVAHFAHVGGMLWGFLLLWMWKKQGKIYF